MNNGKMHPKTTGRLLRRLCLAAAVVLMMTVSTGCAFSPVPNPDPTTAIYPDSVTGVNYKPSSETMPDVTGLKKEDAIKLLADLGIHVKTVEIETDKAGDGCVFNHVPTAGKPVNQGEEATLYIAKNKPAEKKENKTSSKTEYKDTGTKTGSTTYLYCIAADFVSLRAKPNVNSKELVKVPSGDGMIYLNDKSGSWYYVRYGDWYGYVYEDYVSFSQYTGINYKPDDVGGNTVSYGGTLYCTARDFVSLRADTSASSREILRIPCGDAMTYLNSSSGKWMLVEYGSKRGYVYSDYVSYDKSDVPSSSDSGITFDTDSPDYLYCTASDFVALRACADVNSTEFARIPHGCSMVYLKSKCGHWYFVQYGCKKGYVYDKYVSFDVNDAN